MDTRWIVRAAGKAAAVVRLLGAPRSGRKSTWRTARVIISAALFVLFIWLLRFSRPSKEPIAFGALIDERDDKTYKTVKMPDGKMWTAENLNYQADSSWCYENNADSCEKYGRLYAWNAAMKACPAGYHLPSIWEWNHLMATMPVYRKSPRELQSRTGWSYNSHGTDNYGWSALPGGYRDPDGNFNTAGSNGYWWTFTEINGAASYRSMSYNGGWYEVYEDRDNKGGAYSVRCVADAKYGQQNSDEDGWTHEEWDAYYNSLDADSLTASFMNGNEWECGPMRRPRTVRAALKNDTLWISGKGAMRDYLQSVILSETFSRPPGWEQERLEGRKRSWVKSWPPWRYKSVFDTSSPITDAVIKNGVTRIGVMAFAGMTKLRTVSIPASVDSISYAAFRGCDSLASVNVAPGNARYCSVDGVLFNKDTTTLLAYPRCKRDGAYVIPNSVTAIGGDVSFRGPFLKSVTIGGGVKNFGKRAFSGYAASRHPLENARDGAWLVLASAREEAFWNLESINAAPDNALYSSVDGVLFNKDKTALLLYPSGRRGAYAIPDGVKAIEREAFYACTGLTSVTINNGVTSIGSSAFAGCTGLTSVTIPGGVKSIEMFTFKDCAGLESVTFENGVESIKAYAFAECVNLTSVKFPAGVRDVDTYAFSISGERRREEIARIAKKRESWTIPRRAPGGD